MAKGGKREGAGRKIANHTIAIAEARKRLVEEYLKVQGPIDQALIKKAKDGEIPAIKELYDRVYGKSLQAVEMTGKDGKDLIPESDERKKIADSFHAFLRGNGK